MINLEPVQATFPFNLENIRGMMGVYMFTNKKNSMMYIGKGNDLCKRFLSYNSDLRRISKNNRFGNAVRKYSFQGFNLKIIELYSIDQLSFFLNLEGLTRKEKSLKIGKFLCEREAFWIQEFNATNKNIGYNTCSRSNDTSGVIPTDEQRKKLSEAKKGEKNGFWGKKHDSKFKRKVDQIDLISGQVIRVWDSMYEVRQYLGLKKCQSDRIYAVLRGKKKQFRGFGWRKHIEQ